MKKTKTDVYCCEYCGKLYINSQEATECELACKQANKRMEEFDQWYAKNTPEYEVGDVVELRSRVLNGCANRFFVVKQVRKNQEFPAWVYSGASGYDSGDYYEPEAVRDHYQSDINKRVMTAAEYSAWCDDIRMRLPNKYSCEFSLLRGGEFGLAVSVFRESDSKDVLQE